jgi:hypothetical protein
VEILGSAAPSQRSRAAASIILEPGSPRAKGCPRARASATSQPVETDVTGPQAAEA